VGGPQQQSVLQVSAKRVRGRNAGVCCLNKMHASSKAVCFKRRADAACVRARMSNANQVSRLRV